jgi:predicted glutamine amidotransferase
MCELLAVAAARPFALGPVLDWARRIEVMGFAGYGWGLAWTAADGISMYKNPGPLAGDQPGAERLAATEVTRALIHLRRPSDPTTVTMADTQPFVDEARSFAFCHNGFFKLAESFRETLPGQLKGRADSEVGFRLVEKLIRAGKSPSESLIQMHHQLTGTANCGYLGRDGQLLVYHANPVNPGWTFTREGMEVLVTGLHWPGRSGLDLLFPDLDAATRINEGVTVVADRIAAAA